jgi:hypothetical protein
MTQAWFDDHLYAPAPIAGRRIFFCFNESVHVVLKRLVAAARRLEASTKVDKVSQQRERSSGAPIADTLAGSFTVDTCKENARLHRSPLRNVVVVGVPFGDDIADPMPGIEPYSTAAFKEAYQKYEQILDTPKSEEILESKQYNVHAKPYFRRKA